jgi:hypothetical protein
MGRGTIAIAVALALAALVVAGCGGGSDSSTSTVSVSKAAFIKEADAVCKKGTERMQLAILDFLKQHNVKRPNKAQSEKLVGTTIVPSVQTELKELKKLDAPEGDEERVNAIISALEEGLEIAEDNPEAVVGSSDAVFGISGRLAGEYGAEVCGSR